MRVRVDSTRCQGHNRCYLICAEVFDIDDEGYASVRDEEVAAELEARVKLAAGNCPERAILVWDDAQRP